MFGIEIQRVNEIEQSATEVWRKYCFSQLPVPTRRIIAAVGSIQTYSLGPESEFEAVFDLRNPYPPFTLGLRARRNSENETFYGRRLRFSEAHELGHFFMHPDLKVLHREDYNTVVDAVELGNFILAEHENEANLFAAALLMPQERFESDLEGVRIRNVDDWHRSLQRKYEVSLAALDMRIARLMKGMYLSGYASESDGRIQSMIPTLDLELADPEIAKEAWRCNPRVRDHVVRSLPKAPLSDFWKQVRNLPRQDLAAARIDMHSIRLSDIIPIVGRAICANASICGCNRNGARLHYLIELACVH